MSFEKALNRVIDFILAAPTKLGPAFLNKVDTAYAYMRIWVRLEDIALVSFLVPKATPDKEELLGFHLSIPMLYVGIHRLLLRNDREIQGLNTGHQAAANLITRGYVNTGRRQ